MNILHLHTGLNLTCGISKAIYLIALYPGEKNKHFVLALNGDAQNKFTNSGINTALVKTEKKSVYRVLKYLKRFIEENKIDVIHSHHRYFDFIAYLFSFTKNIKRVTSVQSFVCRKKILSYKSPVLLAAGDSVKRHLIEYFNIKEERIVVFNNFIDENEIPEISGNISIMEELKIPSGSYVFGYIGRFSIKDKGIDILLNAFEKFSEKYSNTFLILVGEGSDINKFNIPVDVKIISPRQNIFEYYGIFDCLILPSRIDPFPLTVLETGLMKIPFIGSDVNGISEIIEEGKDGLLFEKNNTDMLINKMEIFYKDRDYAKKCAGNLNKKVLNKYNRKKALQTLENIYDKL